jgi:uncharacterized protein YjbI with pentapeptide repeats
LVITAGGLAVVVSIICGYVFGWKWAGVSDRNLWDWIELLIVPLGLALVALLFNSWRSTREQEQEVEHQREQALRDYLDAMTELMLEHDLSKSGPEDAVRTVARTRTLALLRRLDGERRGLVLRFLHDSNLVARFDAVVDLRGADLTEANLEGGFLTRVNLFDANLTRANLTFAHLNKADLSHADLSRADLTAAFLTGAKLSGARLNHAGLGGANLSEADLDHADLSHANLSHTHLSDASLRHANLSHANLHDADLSDATLRHAKLKGANLSEAVATERTIWPDGFDPLAAGLRAKTEDELWAEAAEREGYAE